jgi:hypothetical protein
MDEIQQAVQGFTPSEWVVKKDFVHDGNIVSPGEPVPALSVEAAEGLARRGVITKPGLRPKEEAPKTAAEYLRCSDPMVVRRIRQHKPAKKTLREMLKLADQQGRLKDNRTLHETLLLALKAPVEA